MHDGLQLGTLVLVLFGILLTRYDFNALRKEMRDEIAGLRKELHEEIAGLRKELHEEIAGLRKEMGAQADLLRADVNRQTTAINSMLFNHHERLAVIETKMEEEK